MNESFTIRAITCLGAWVFSATVRSTRIFKEASTEAGYEWLSVAKQLWHSSIILYAFSAIFWGCKLLPNPFKNHT